MAIKRPPKAELAEAINKHHGNLLAVAAAYGVTRRSVYAWVERYGLWPEVRQARETIVDLAERKLIERIADGEPRLIEFVLRTLGRDRGYAEATEHRGEVRIVVTYERPESE